MTLEECERQLKRYEKIVKQSDKQEKRIIELYHKIEEKEQELRKLHEYDKKQQLIAKSKIEENIVEEIPPYFNKKIIFKPLDILSGDIYSIYNLENEKLLYFIADGQGHGISPAITVFNIANIFKSTMKFFKKNLDKEDSLSEYLNQYILEPIKLSLIEAEQLALSVIFLDLKKHKLHYAIGGMYPTYIQNNNEIIKIKANNIPFSKYTNEINVNIIEFDNLKKILSYTDGIVEIFNPQIMPPNLIQNPSLIDKLPYNNYDDDVTVIYLEKKD